MKKNKSSPPAQKTETAEAPPPPQYITSLSDVEAICAQAIEVTVFFLGHPNPLVFPGRRLLPFEARETRRLLERAVPPLIPDGDGKEPRYDFQDEKFREDSAKHRAEARAYALWLAFPQFAKRAAELKAVVDTLEARQTFIETRELDNDMLNALFDALTKPVIDERAFMGFTSGSSSPKS